LPPGLGAPGGGGGGGGSESSGAHTPQVLMWVMAVFCSLNVALLYLLLRLGSGVQRRLALTAAPQPEPPSAA
jgi:hypothetical protein